MKGGIAACIFALRTFSELLPTFPGEIVLALAGDEESMGERGTQSLIDRVPMCTGDAVIVADVGSPRVVRCGEKGLIWMTLEANGKSAHGAHVHRGVNAIDTLIDALESIKSLEKQRMPPLHPAASVMAHAFDISEPLGGQGEQEAMSRVTVNVGKISGGDAPNLVPGSASADLDIRVPIGVQTQHLRDRISLLLQSHPGVIANITRCYEATWTPTEAPIVRHALDVAQEILGEKAVPNMRVGASDARLWRRAGMPTIVSGLTPYNLGAEDECLDIAELPRLASLLTLVAFDYLHDEVHRAGNE